MTKGAPSDEHILSGIRGGDDAAFRQLVNHYNATLVRLAGCYVNTSTIAEEVVQDTWMGFLNGLDRFEGRSSLRTWIFSILTNNARDRARKERRYVPFSSMARSETADDDPAVEAGMFQGPEEMEPGHWRSRTPGRWSTDPEKALMTKEALACAEAAIKGLKPAQRAVLVLRDLQGFSSEEVCNILDVATTNQRVLLHRARSKVRRALEAHFGS